MSSKTLNERSVSSVNSISIGTIIPYCGFAAPSITSVNFSTGSVKLSVVVVPGADGVDGDGFSSTNVVSNVFMSGYTLNGSVDNIGAYQVGQFVRLTVTSDDAVNPWIPVGDWIEGEVRAVNGIGVSIHINGAKPGIVGQYISGNLGTSRDTQFSMSVAAPSYTQYAGVYGAGQNLNFSDGLNGWSNSTGPNRPYTVGTRVRIVDQGVGAATATGVIAYISSFGTYGLVLDAYNAAFDTLSSGSWKDVQMTLTGEPGTGTNGLGYGGFTTTEFTINLSTVVGYGFVFSLDGNYAYQSGDRVRLHNVSNALEYIEGYIGTPSYSGIAPSVTMSFPVNVDYTTANGTWLTEDQLSVSLAGTPGFSDIVPFFLMGA